MEKDSKLTLAPVTILQTVGTINLPPERVLNAALTANMKEVVIIGWDADGEFYFASSAADGGSVLWHLALAKKRLLEI